MAPQYIPPDLREDYEGYKTLTNIPRKRFTPAEYKQVLEETVETDLNEVMQETGSELTTMQKRELIARLREAVHTDALEEGAVQERIRWAVLFEGDDVAFEALERVDPETVDRLSRLWGVREYKRY